MDIAKKEAIAARLKLLHEKNNGRLTPDIVIADAKKKTSPLHDQFEWDLNKAAAYHWIQQARQIINSVKIVVVNETKSVSTVCYVRDPTADSDEQGYVSLPTLKADPDLSRQSLVYEFTRAAGALHRARKIAEALDMMAEVDEVISHIGALKDRAIEAEFNTVQ